MRSKILISITLITCFLGCTQKQTQNPSLQQAVAQINNYTVTVDDFNHEVAFLRPVFHSVSSIPPIELKLGILDEMINRELLLEEAQKLNIDKDPEFMRQIENFWRLSLIKELIKHELSQIEASTTVSDEEIKSEYKKEMAETKSIKPLEEIAPQIKEVVFRLKVQNALQAWEDSLKTNAVIKRNYGVLNAIPIGYNNQGGANGQFK